MTGPHEEIALLRQALQERDRTIASQAAQIRAMAAKLDALLRRLFGKKSERLDERQLLLLLGVSGGDLPPAPEKGAPPEDEPEPPAGGPRGRRRSGRSERWPEDLPVEEKVILPGEVEREPEAYRQIGREVTEQLDYEPARFFIRRTVRPTFVLRGEGSDLAPLTAPLPPRAIARGIAGPGLLAAVVVGKYCDHLPLYRQQEIFEMRHRVRLSRQNMSRWVALAAFWLKPIYEIIRTGVLGGGYMQVDETPVRYLDPGHGKTRTGYLWTTLSPGGDAVYHWRTGRGSDNLDDIIPEGFRGVIGCDAYAAYPAFARRREGVVLVPCMAHIRRKFFEAKEEAPSAAGWVLRQIGLLYRIEAGLREAGSGPALRQSRRAAESSMVYRRLAKALLRMRRSGRFLPSSAMAKALDYAISNWAAMALWIEDGRLEIDNNLVENAIRPTALGKKNWLFMGCAQAGETGAILFTIVQSCRRWRIDPFEYLRDVLDRIPGMTNHRVAELTPRAWADARKPRQTKPLGQCIA